MTIIALETKNTISLHNLYIIYFYKHYNIFFFFGLKITILLTATSVIGVGVTPFGYEPIYYTSFLIYYYYYYY